MSASATYPHAPGWKTEDPETSKAAALAVEGRAAMLREKCHACLRGAALTADEVAELVGESVLAVRPRVTELRQQGKVEQATGTDGKPLRRRNASGATAAVWRAVSEKPKTYTQSEML